MIITGVLVFPPTLGLIPSYIFRLYIGQWAVGELNNGLTQHITIGRFLVLYGLVTWLLHDGLLVLDASLICWEWSSGKIPWLRHKLSGMVDLA